MNLESILRLRLRSTAREVLKTSRYSVGKILNNWIGRQVIIEVGGSPTVPHIQVTDLWSGGIGSHGHHLRRVTEFINHATPMDYPIGMARASSYTSH